jgi:hypothetical protein
VRPDRSKAPHPPNVKGEPDQTSPMASWRLREPGCPACAARREAETNALAWFFLENYRERATLRALTNSCYCVRHLAALLARPEPKLSVTFEYLVREEIRLVRRFRDELRRKRWAPLRRSKAGERRLPRHARPADEPCRCPLCESGATAATVAIEEVLSLLEAEEGRAAYAASDGLCGPHAWVALRDAPAESAGWLAADVERRLQSIGAELSRYFAYQRGEDQAYVDSDAWVRATRLVWGESAGSERELSRDAATAPVTT